MGFGRRNSTRSPGTVRPYAARRAVRGLLLLLVLVVVGALVGLGVSRLIPERYAADAQLQANIPRAGGGSAAGLGVGGSTLAGIAASGRALATRPDVIAAARSDLRGVDAAAAARDLRFAIEPGTGILVITAHASSPSTASRVARAFGLAVRRAELNAARSGYRRAAAGLKAGGAPDRARVAQLEALAHSAVPLQILRLGTPRGSTRSPSVGLLVPLGALAGLLIALLILLVARLRPRLGGRIPDLPAMRRLDAPLVGAVPDGLGHAEGKALAFRAVQLEPFRVLRRNTRDLTGTGEPQVILITSADPGAGKSVTAGGLAAVCASAGRRVLVVECDLRRPVQAKRLGVAPEPGLSEHLRGQVEPPATLRRVTLRTLVPDHERWGGEGGVDPVLVVGGTPAPDAGHLLAGPAFAEMIRFAREGYDTVILDGTPLMGIADAGLLLEHADAVLVCAALGQATTASIASVLDTAARGGERPVGLVATGVQPRHDPAGEADAYRYYAVESPPS